MIDLNKSNVCFCFAIIQPGVVGMLLALYVSR